MSSEPPHSADEIVLCIGKFDGVHLGHQAVIRAARRYAHASSLAVMSFWPHPSWALRQDARFAQAITPPRIRARLLRQLGVARLYQVNFTEEYAQISPETFVFEHLPKMGVRRVVVGDGFNFGKGPQSTTQELVELCRQVGIAVDVVPPVLESGRIISSTTIRQHIEAGRVEAAKALLNRPYKVTGEVVHGDALGREIGFPTANLQLADPYVLPKPGVYVGMVEVMEEEAIHPTRWFALISAGYRPAVQGDSYRIEAYLLDFSGDLYGREISISFVFRLRDELNFPSLDALVGHMRQDEAMTRDMLGLAPRR